MTSQPSGAPDPRAGAEQLGPGGQFVIHLGQTGFGYLDLCVFDEDNHTYWWDITGRRHRVTDMTPDYRHNVLAFLERNARYFHLMTVRRRLTEVYSDLADGRLHPRDLERVHGLIELDPITWITSTPIAQALHHAPQPAPHLSDPPAGPELGTSTDRSMDARCQAARGCAERGATALLLGRHHRTPPAVQGSTPSRHSDALIARADY